MFCPRCQAFCTKIGESVPNHLSPSHPNGVKATTNKPTSSPPILWPCLETILFSFSNPHELNEATKAPCPICRCIRHCLHPNELPSKGNCTVTLVLSQDNSKPMLRVRFEGAIHLTKTLAIYYPGPRKSPALAATLLRCSELENTSTGSDASFELAEHWLKACLEHHPGCPRPRPGWLPTRVVDVDPRGGGGGGAETVRLVETAEIPLETVPAEKRTYVTLSHCWGGEQTITTRETSLADHKLGIDMSRLSRTFRDAVIATRRLGHRFLWIDSLCIVQDSKEDWEKESVQMCTIYQRSVFTIMAAHASRGSVGCFVQRDGLAQMPFQIRIRDHVDDSDVDSAFFLPLSCSTNELFRRVLYTRAWVLQEQVLSRCMLVYYGDQVWWECRTKRGSERNPDGGLYLTGLERFLRAFSAEGDPFVRANSDSSTVIEMQESLHIRWCYLMMDYMHRAITKPSDRLIAVDGIAKAIEQRTSNRYLAGLWKDQLLLGLLWKVPWQLSPFTHWDQMQDTTTKYDSSSSSSSSSSSTDSDAPLIAPSWSWASVTYPVVWTAMDDINALWKMKPLCTITSASVHGTPFNQTGTLTIQGQTRRLYINPFYQSFHFVPQKKDHPAIQALAITSTNRTYESDWPYYFAYVSLYPPKHQHPFHPFPLEFSPDTFLDRNQQITFIALAELPTDLPSSTPVKANRTRPSILTLALHPTGRRPNEYRRVGFATWYNCSWYGYYCVDKEYPSERWWDMTTKYSMGWTGVVKGFMLRCVAWVRRAVLNQPVVEMAEGEFIRFEELVGGRWGRHCHEGGEEEKMFREGWVPESEIITIV